MGTTGSCGTQQGSCSSSDKDMKNKDAKNPAQKSSDNSQSADRKTAGKV